MRRAVGRQVGLSDNARPRLDRPPRQGARPRLDVSRSFFVPGPAVPGGLTRPRPELVSASQLLTAILLSLSQPHGLSGLYLRA